MPAAQRPVQLYAQPTGILGDEVTLGIISKRKKHTAFGKHNSSLYALLRRLNKHKQKHVTEARGFRLRIVCMGLKVHDMPNTFYRYS